MIEFKENVYINDRTFLLDNTCMTDILFKLCPRRSDWNARNTVTRLSFLLFFCLIFVYSFFCGSVCEPVGVEDRNKIPDASMTASSYYDNDYLAYYGRLNGNRGEGAWCTETATDTTDYLQVDMGAVHPVCAVATQGLISYSEWTTSYKVHLSAAGVTWESYKENNVEKVTKIKYSCIEEKAHREILKLYIIQQDHCVLFKPYKLCSPRIFNKYMLPCVCYVLIKIY